MLHFSRGILRLLQSAGAVRVWLLPVAWLLRAGSQRFSITQDVEVWPLAHQRRAKDSLLDCFCLVVTLHKTALRPDPRYPCHGTESCLVLTVLPQAASTKQE